MNNEDFFPNDYFYIEALSFRQCGKIAQTSNKRFDDEQLLSSPIIYLFRHSAELLLKALIIKEAINQYADDWNNISFPPHNRKLSSMHSIKALFETWKELLSFTLINPIKDAELMEASKLVDRIEACDPISTFLDIRMIRKETLTKSNL